MTDIERLNAMSVSELNEALATSSERRLAVLRAAAEGGAVDAQLVLGQMLLDSDAPAAAPREALQWFSLAAKAGHPMGMNMVGRCLEHGWGTPRDMTAAAQWYEAAAARNFDWGLYNLATLLALGNGVSQDRKRALALFHQAAARGHAKSMNMVGSFHEDGWAVEADRGTAAVWYKRAADGGDFRGQFNHARMLIEAGRIEEGIAWIHRVPETATPRFLDQIREWLRQRSESALQNLALDL